jgi:hypothetical protein
LLWEAKRRRNSSAAVYPAIRIKLSSYRWAWGRGDQERRTYHNYEEETWWILVKTRKISKKWRAATNEVEIKWKLGIGLSAKDGPKWGSHAANDGQD